MKVPEYWYCGVGKEHGLINHLIKKKKDLIMSKDPVPLSEENILQK